MTEKEIHIAKALNGCSLLPGSWNKRFIKGMAAIAENKSETELTEKQKEWLYRLLFTYRKQVPHTYRKFAEHPHCKKINTSKHISRPE